MQYFSNVLFAVRFLAAAAAASASYGLFTADFVSIVSILIIFSEAISLVSAIISRKIGEPAGGRALRPYVDSIGRIAEFLALSNLSLAWAAVPLIMAILEIIIVYCGVALAGTGASLETGIPAKAKWLAHFAAAVALAVYPLALSAEHLTIISAAGSVIVILFSSVAALHAVVKAFSIAGRR